VKHMLARIDGAASAAQLGDIFADFIASGILGPIKLSVASAGGESKVLFVNGGGFILPDATFFFFTSPPSTMTASSTSRPTPTLQSDRAWKTTTTNSICSPATAMTRHSALPTPPSASKPPWHIGLLKNRRSIK